MKKIGIFYGSTTGYTADAANRIAQALGVDLTNVFDVKNTEPSKVGDYDILVLGASTWGAGDMQDDMEDFLDGVQGMWLGGKKVALFGCGDENMALTFGGALAEMYKKLKDTGAEFIAPFNTDGYKYDESPAVKEGKCIGLILDDVNHPELAQAKIEAWVKEIK